MRLSEMLANILANAGNPLAVFDISGVLTFFLRAYITLSLGFFSVTKTFEFTRLKLLDFTVHFKRPAFLGTLSGDTLTLATGSSAHNRLNGVVTDVAETIHVSGTGGSLKLWSDQFGRSVGNAQTFSGVKH
ncbi:MAG: hypothetical protein E6I84_15740, partial [Chloroflexi bacterium]